MSLALLVIITISSKRNLNFNDTFNARSSPKKEKPETRAMAMATAVMKNCEVQGEQFNVIKARRRLWRWWWTISSLNHYKKGAGKLKQNKKQSEWAAVNRARERDVCRQPTSSAHIFVYIRSLCWIRGRQSCDKNDFNFHPNHHPYLRRKRDGNRCIGGKIENSERKLNTRHREFRLIRTIKYPSMFFTATTSHVDVLRYVIIVNITPQRIVNIKHRRIWLLCEVYHSS